MIAPLPTPHEHALKPLRVGEILLDKQLISHEQIEQALAFQRNRGHAKLLGEVLVELGFVTEEQVMETLADAYGIPFVRLNARYVDPEVVQLLAGDFCEKQGVIPMFLIEGKLTLAVHEPANVFVIEEVERLAGHPVQIVAATSRDIRATLASLRPGAGEIVIDDLVQELQEEELELVERQTASIDLSDLETAATESPVIKLVNHVIAAAVNERASDIHIEPDDGSVRVRYRIDGLLFEKMKPPYTMVSAIVSRIKIMAGLDIAERRVPQDGGISVVIDRRQVDLRVSTMPGKFGEKVVIRIIDKSSLSVGLDKLGFSPDMLVKWRSLVQQPNGIVLVTGPTGSGKSTTLYATLNEINDASINISTVEDPVENNVKGVNQFQVNTKAGFTFAGALRSLLRQDPDVVMVGEVRDGETAKIAVQAALTGHLVLSTLHTNDAVSAVTRLFNMDVESYLVAASVRGVLAQRLVRRICPQCKIPAELTAPEQATLARLADGAAVPAQVFRGEGCTKCRGTGFSGRVGIYELYLPDDESLDVISRGASLQELRQLARKSGCWTTLRQDGLTKVAAGATTMDELLSATTA